MPLSPPKANRTHLHTRDISFKGYEREDGLWDVEGHITDTKTYSFPNQDRGTIEAGEPLHDMWVRLTVDTDLKIHGIEVTMDGTPWRMCPTIADNFQRLVGLRIERGWYAEVLRRVGGLQGCTHVVELFRPMATAVMQTIFPARERQRQADIPGGKKLPPAPLLDTCHAWAKDSPMVKERYPDYIPPGGDSHKRSTK